MITGIIAAVILIAVLPPAINNGEIGPIVVAVVIAVLLLLLGAASREHDRAYNNWTHYWAKGGPDGKTKKDRKKEAKEAAESEREWKRIGDMWQEGDEYCPSCGGKIGLAARIMDNGKKKNLYMCMSCGRTYKGNPLD